MLILITPEKNIAREVEILHALFEMGLERLQVRKPNFSKLEYEEYLEQIDAKWRSKIYLHQYHVLVEQFGLGGRHYRKSDFPFKELHSIDSSSGAHTIEEANELLKNIEMVFVSPVFESISKQGYSSEEDFSILKLEENQRKRFIALGGINELNIQDAKHLGFEHFAVLGSVWKSGEPIEAWRKLSALVS